MSAASLPGTASASKPSNRWSKDLVNTASDRRRGSSPPPTAIGTASRKGRQSSAVKSRSRTAVWSAKRPLARLGSAAGLLARPAPAALPLRREDEPEPPTSYWACAACLRCCPAWLRPAPSRRRRHCDVAASRAAPAKVHPTLAAERSLSPLFMDDAVAARVEALAEQLGRHTSARVAAKELEHIGERVRALKVVVGSLTGQVRIMSIMLQKLDAAAAEAAAAVAAAEAAEAAAAEAEAAEAEAEAAEAAAAEAASAAAAAAAVRGAQNKTCFVLVVAASGSKPTPNAAAAAGHAEQCNRNPRCIRGNRHPGHCTSSQTTH